MKIPAPTPSSASYSALPGRTLASAEPPAAIAATSDLRLSDAARAPQSATLREAPQHEARIQALRQAVQEGRYQVDARQVADRVLQWSL